MFVATDDFHVPVKVLRSESPDQAQRQEAFRTRVLATDTAARNFSTPDELANGVRDALWNELQRRTVRGRTNPSAAAPSAPSPAVSATSSAGRRSWTSSAPP